MVRVACEFSCPARNTHAHDAAWVCSVPPCPPTQASNHRYVLKRVRLARQNARERQASVMELKFLSNLRHRNILQVPWRTAGLQCCNTVVPYDMPLRAV